MKRTVFPRLAGFVLHEDGATAVEFALLSAFFISFMLAVIDLGRIAWTLNVDEAATREGARLAIVSPLVAGGLGADYSSSIAGNALADGNGQAVPAGVASTQTCTGSKQCIASNGAQSAFDQTTFSAIVGRMQQYDSRIQDNNVEIVYQHVGLGVIGNPYNHDIEPLVTVRLKNMAFHTGALQIFGLGKLTLPVMSTTLVGEHQQ